MAFEETVRLSLDDVRTVTVNRSFPWETGRPIIVFAHGAGSDVFSEFFQLLDDGLSRFPINRLYLNFPYRVAGKKMPDRLPVLQESWRQVIQWVHHTYPEVPLFIGGKSMGGRIAATVAEDYPQLTGVIFLGYPLHPPGKPDRLRDAPLYTLNLPMLFVQGTRDNLAKFDLIRQVVDRMGSHASLVVVTEGDHSFKVPRKLGKSYKSVLYWVAEHINFWVKQQLYNGN